MPQKKNNTNTKKGIFDFEKQPYIVVLFLIIVPLLSYIVYRIQASEQNLISYGVLFIVAGVIFEGRRLSESWKHLLFNLLAAFAFSFFAFLPGKGNYDFDHRITTWPYYFLFIFILIAMTIHEDKVTKKLDEGMTLIQSTAVVYWIFSEEVFIEQNIFFMVISILGVMFALFSYVHAFTYIKLDDLNRFLLSLGSSLIMLLFSADYTYSIFTAENTETAATMNDLIYGYVQYFLLGVSGIYAVHNLYMVLAFFPSKEHFFDKHYFQEIKELKNLHVSRYSKSQIKISSSLLFLLFSGLVFVLNFNYQIVSNHTAIWILFVSFPAISFIQKQIEQMK